MCVNFFNIFIPSPSQNCFQIRKESVATVNTLVGQPAAAGLFVFRQPPAGLGPVLDGDEVPDLEIEQGLDADTELGHEGGRLVLNASKKLIHTECLLFLYSMDSY